jgi:hypothetical protein
MLRTRYSCHGLTKLENFSTFLKKKIEIQNFMKILPVGAELFHADRRTSDGLDEAGSRFSQFCELS